jgi:predicted molibdopterin-dependent oxidoreductase YjgC
MGMGDRSTLRVEDGVGREPPFTFTLDGIDITAFPGETIAAALLATGRRALRHTEKAGRPRGIFCGMGVCFDCLVTVEGRTHLRACLTPAEPGMHVVTQDEAGWRRSRT